MLDPFLLHRLELTLIPFCSHFLFLDYWPPRPSIASSGQFLVSMTHDTTMPWHGLSQLAWAMPLARRWLEERISREDEGENGGGGGGGEGQQGR